MPWLSTPLKSALNNEDAAVCASVAEQPMALKIASANFCNASKR